jgi:predicted transcriptional regulator
MIISTKDETDNKIIANVNLKPGIRLSELSKAVEKSVETIRYRVYSLERSGELKLVSERHSLKIYPASGGEAQ